MILTIELQTLTGTTLTKTTLTKPFLHLVTFYFLPFGHFGKPIFDYIKKINLFRAIDV
jgi:hypothetical protein